MSGLIGKKIGMTSIFDENGKNIPCTVIEAGPCIVTQVRTEEVDGYNALQLGFDDATEKNATKAAQGHAKKAGTSVKRKVVEFKGFGEEYKLGDAITVEQFIEGEFVDISGTSKGKGFQGVVKRHWFLFIFLVSFVTEVCLLPVVCFCILGLLFCCRCCCCYFFCFVCFSLLFVRCFLLLV